MITAHDFSTLPPNEQKYAFGIADAAQALRKLADEIENQNTLVHNVAVTSRASRDNWTETVVTLTLCERHPYKIVDPAEVLGG